VFTVQFNIQNSTTK